MTVMVVGGAGYIGSHMVRYLLDAGRPVVTLDNFSTGFRDAVTGGEIVEADVADETRVKAALKTYRVRAVMHFASCIQVGESVAQPLKYYCNNVANTLSLLDSMRACGVDKFIFSSSAAIYGEPAAVPIPESHAKAPVNPYGRSKWMVEQILADLERAREIRSISLRYFNAAGAQPDASLGERHDPETHLIPLVLRAATGSAPDIKVFGDDYDTPDGTCIRDYVHVVDLCEAHWLALQRLLDGGHSAAFNLGNGNGFSVKEVITAAERVTGRAIKSNLGPRRVGDPARLVADATLAREQLGWQPKYADLATIVAHAWSWEQRRAVAKGANSNATHDRGGPPYPSRAPVGRNAR